MTKIIYTFLNVFYTILFRNYNEYINVYDE